MGTENNCNGWQLYRFCICLPLHGRNRKDFNSNHFRKLMQLMQEQISFSSQKNYMWTCNSCRVKTVKLVSNLFFFHQNGNGKNAIWHGNCSLRNIADLSKYTVMEPRRTSQTMQFHAYALKKCAFYLKNKAS